MSAPAEAEAASSSAVAAAEEVVGPVAKGKGKEKVVAEASAAPAPAGDGRKGTLVAYPARIAGFKDVVADAAVFRAALEGLHAQMGTKLKVPIIGGKDLDLHQLFKEVTSRGGIDKVKSANRWREVTASFIFPATATNASFMLKKYYMSLLYHFEQLYLFEAQGWYQETDSRSISCIEMKAEGQASRKRKRQSNSCSSDLAASSDNDVHVIIDGKFEHGYIVTVIMGSKSTKAVLYNCTEEPAVPTVAPCVAIDSAEGIRPRRRRRRKKLSTTDPNHPKPNRSGYNFFFQDQHRKLKPEYPGQDRLISKMIGERWNNLSPEDKAVYQEKGVEDKARYQKQLALYRELRTGQPISNAVPIQQRLPQKEVTIDEVDSKVSEGDILLSNQGYSSSSSSSDETASSGEKNAFVVELNTETSPEQSMETTDSHGQPDPSADGERFELRRRENPKIDEKRDMPPN